MHGCEEFTPSSPQRQVTLRRRVENACLPIRHRREAWSARRKTNRAQVLRKQRGIERLGMHFKWRSFEDSPVPLHILARRVAHHRWRLGCGFGMKVWNGKRHRDLSVKMMTVIREECADRFPKNFVLAPSGPLSQSWSEICGEGKLVADLVRRRERGGAEDRFVAGRIGTGDDLDPIPWPIMRSGLEPKKMERKVHRRGGLRVRPLYRHAAANY